VALHFVTLTPAQALGIPVSLVGSVFLAVGAELQHRGVPAADTEGRPGRSSALRIGQLLSLARSPAWLLGSAMLAVAVVLQLVSLYLAPLTVVQPLGALALVVTALLNARVTRSRLDASAISAIAFCVLGVAVFVTIAAFTTTSRPIDDTQLVVVLVILGIVLATFGALFATLRRRFTTLLYILGAGVLFGFVATLAKVIIDRVHTIVVAGSGPTSADWLTGVCLLGLAVAGVGGLYLVQTAYSTGAPELVVAGLTVIDPFVGVTIGAVVLGEARSAPAWAIIGFLAAGALAVTGVVRLARHPAKVAVRRDRIGA
jgi:drug/metabolite transporter (DMT)-like permease